MKTKHLTTFLMLFVFYASYGQDYYFINTKSGLNVRAEASLASNKIANLRYGALVVKTEDSNTVLTIIDNGKEIHGKFVKIKYWPDYLTSKTIIGYVFDGYLKKQTNALLAINKIDKETYIQFLKVASKERTIPNKISNLNTIKSILKDRVEWFDDTYIKCITLNNGEKLRFNREVIDFGFSEGQSSYYPNEEILVLEGGHGSDVTFSINTGATEMFIGNPDYIISSPKNTYRLNGYFGGQECISYFFQKKVNDKFEYVTAINFDYNTSNFKEFYWVSEHEFIYILINYNRETEKEFQDYYKGTLK